MVHCGVDTLRFSPVNRQRNGPLRLLAVGRLHPIKAYPLLLQACRKLTDAEFDWTLTLVGDGPSRASLESIAAELGISERVRFAGAISQDEIQLYFARADVLVMSSFMEGVPVVLMEAMATGLPIVSTNVGGIPELVSPTCGVLTPPGSAEGLAAAVLELAHRAVEWPEMAIASRARIEREYDIRQTAGGMHQLFISNIPASGR